MASVVRFHHGDESWWLSDLTGNEVVAIEKHLGINYLDLKIGANARDTIAVLATFLSRTRSEVEVAEIIDGLKIRDISDCWDVEEDDLPTEFEDGIPKAEAADTSTTTGSSSSPARRSAGRPTSPVASLSATSSS